MSFMTAEVARTKADASKFGSVPFFSPGRVATLLHLLGDLAPDGTSATAPARVRHEWNQRVIAADANHAPTGPITPSWHVPDTYDDPTGQAAVLNLIKGDFDTAADLAIRWKVLGDEDAAEGCVRILTAWSAQVIPASKPSTATGPLVWCNRWPVMIQAAMLVKDYAGYTTALDTALKDVTRAGRRLGLAYTNGNNTAVWGVVYEIAAAVFLADRAMFDRAIRRWYALFDLGIRGNVPVDEVYRQGGGYGNGSDGLWYSNFTLYAYTVAAEWARFNGAWLYDYRGADGSTFRGFAELVRSWTFNPGSFPFNSSGTPSTTSRSLPHDEILHALWPSTESQSILDRFPSGNDRDSTGVRGAVLAYRDRPLYG